MSIGETIAGFTLKYGPGPGVSYVNVCLPFSFSFNLYLSGLHAPCRRSKMRRTTENGQKQQKIKTTATISRIKSRSLDYWSVPDRTRTHGRNEGAFGVLRGWSNTYGRGNNTFSFSP